jgi:hypothetical protein
MAEGLMEVSRLGVNTVAGNLTAEPSTIYIHQPRATLTQLQTILYDQYEVRLLHFFDSSCGDTCAVICRCLRIALPARRHTHTAADHPVQII